MSTTLPPYGLDLTSISLDDFQQTLETDALLPSRMMLREHITEHFAALRTADITHVQGVIDALSTKAKIAKFAQASGIPEDYLILLRRQARSLIPTPVPLADIPGVDQAAVKQLAAQGIRHTQHLFERTQTPSERDLLALATDIPSETLLDLVRMADIARAGWVGPVFLRLLFESGINSLSELAHADAETLYRETCAVNAARQYTKAGYSVKDIAACIAVAQSLPNTIRY